MNSKRQKCPVCGGVGLLHRTLADKMNDRQYDYYRCQKCRCIFIDIAVIELMDNGKQLLSYDGEYWKNEIPSAIERSYGAVLARMAEVFYYSRIPIHKFLDAGTGAGYFLDAVAIYLPEHKDIFYGIEKYPPAIENRTSSENYYICATKM